VTLNSHSSSSTRWTSERLVEGHKWLVIIVVGCLRILDMSNTFCLVLLTIVSDLHDHRPREVYRWCNYLEGVIQNSGLEFKCRESHSDIAQARLVESIDFQ
jgi:hypothetical protein